MKNYHFIYFLFIGLLIVIIVRFIVQIRDNNLQLKYYEGQLVGMKDYYELMKIREKEMLKNNGVVLSQNLLMVNDNNDTLRFYNLVGNNNGSHKLIIRYSALACDACLDEEIKNIYDYILQIGNENIIILASSYNVRSLKVRKNNLSVNLQVFLIEEIGIPFEENNTSLFVFMIDKEFIVKDFFIPEKTIPELSKNYYCAIYEKYFKKL